MSAAHVSMSDRDLDALRRAQRAHEPSMEEILASIRTIIAEERDPAKAQEAKGQPPKPAASAPAPQIVYSKDEPAQPRPVAAPQPTTEAGPPKVVWRQAEPEPVEPPVQPAEPPARAADPSDRAAEPDAPLLSPATDTAVASAFDQLSASLAVRSAERAEDLAREMLRPMLKAWLDENLPAIVERLVRAEIERSRARRAVAAAACGGAPYRVVPPAAGVDGRLRF